MTDHAIKRLNRLAKLVHARRYLEIGVATGSTFLAVDCPFKVAVDPHFSFNPQAHQTSTQLFHQTTSDEFFYSFKAEAPFDLIFLDGLHTFEQTIRDFANSLAVASDHAVWVIDDTVPNSAFSALKSPAEARRWRQEAKITDTSWHGDVYKVVFAINDFFPSHSFATAMSPGNPQTVVWRQKRKPAPLFDDFERISRMSYFEFRSYITVMNDMADDDILRAITNAIEPAR